jgi:hypothetical protein
VAGDLKPQELSPLCPRLTALLSLSMISGGIPFGAAMQRRRTKCDTYQSLGSALVFSKAADTDDGRGRPLHLARITRKSSTNLIPSIVYLSANSHRPRESRKYQSRDQPTTRHSERCGSRHLRKARLKLRVLTVPCSRQ